MGCGGDGSPFVAGTYPWTVPTTVLVSQVFLPTWSGFLPPRTPTERHDPSLTFRERPCHVPVRGVRTRVRRVTTPKHPRRGLTFHFLHRRTTPKWPRTVRKLSCRSCSSPTISGMSGTSVTEENETGSRGGRGGKPSVISPKSLGLELLPSRPTLPKDHQGGWLRRRR